LGDSATLGGTLMDSCFEKTLSSKWAKWPINDPQSRQAIDPDILLNYSWRNANKPFDAPARSQASLQKLSMKLARKPRGHGGSRNNHSRIRLPIYQPPIEFNTISGVVPFSGRSLNIVSSSRHSASWQQVVEPDYDAHDHSIVKCPLPLNGRQAITGYPETSTPKSFRSRKAKMASPGVVPC